MHFGLSLLRRNSKARISNIQFLALLPLAHHTTRNALGSFIQDRALARYAICLNARMALGLGGPRKGEKSPLLCALLFKQEIFAPLLIDYL